MASEPAGHRVGAELTGGAFGVKREVFAVGGMSGTARRLLRKRLGSELDAVRDLIRKMEFLCPGAEPSGNAGPAIASEDDQSLAAKPQPEVPMEADGSCDAKRRKVPPLVEQAVEATRTTPDQRERLAARLASLAAMLPDQVVAFLQNRSAGDADYRGDGSEIEMDMQSMKDGALFQLKLLLNKLAPETTPKSHGRAAPDAPGVSCLSQHEDASGKLAAAEEGGDVAIRGGASRIELRDIAEEYGELVEAIGVLLLSPLPRKYVELAEQDEYVDICGDASPVVFPAAKAVESSSSPSSSSSRSGASSSDSGTSSSDSDSGSESESDSEENDSSPLVPPGFGFSKKDDTSAQAAQTPEPASDAMKITGPEGIQDQCAVPTPTVRLITSSSPAPLALPMKNDNSAKPPDSAPEAVQIAKPEELQKQFVAPAPTVPLITKSSSAPAARPKENGNPSQLLDSAQIAKPEELQNQRAVEAAPTVPPITSSPPVPLPLPKDNDTSAQSPKSAPAAVHCAKPEELQNQCAVVATETVPPITSSPPAPAALPMDNDTSAVPPAPAPALEVVHIAEPEELLDLNAEPGPADDPLTVTDLIAKAQEALKRRRQAERNRAREQARRELLAVERAALPDERIHPRDMEQLGIAAFEHIVSTAEDARAARPLENGGGVRSAPGCPSVMQFLGLFLKADDGSEEQEQRPGIAPAGGADMDVEEGEIR